MSETLQDMNAQYMRLRWMAEEGELDEEALADTLEGMEDEWLEKMDAYVGVINLLKGTMAVYDADIKRTTEKKESLKKNIERMKEYMYESFKMRYPEGKPSHKVKYSFWSQNSAESLDLEEADLDSIPQEYMVPQPDKLDREKLLEAVKKVRDEGGELPYGVKLKRTESLRWR